MIDTHLIISRTLRLKLFGTANDSFLYVCILFRRSVCILPTVACNNLA